MGSLRSLRKKEVEPVPPPIPSDDEVIMAVNAGEIRQLKTLLSRGADPNAVNGNADSALGIAVLHGELGMIHLLVRYGADLDQRNACGVTVLHLAVSSSLQGIGPKICNYLLDHGADVNASNSYGWTPLMRAVADDQFHIAKLLIERGADATLRNSNGERALDLLRRGKGSTSLRRVLKPIS